MGGEKFNKIEAMKKLNALEKSINGKPNPMSKQKTPMTIAIERDELRINKLKEDVNSGDIHAENAPIWRAVINELEYMVIYNQKIREEVEKPLLMKIYKERRQQETGLYDSFYEKCGQEWYNETFEL